ncbi:MAG: DUF3592 domain-containing protein [Chloroflexota bacterium]
MITKILLFLAFYIVWVIGSLAVIFGAFTSDQQPGVVPFPAIALYLIAILIPVWLFNRWVMREPGWSKTVLADGKQATATIVSVKDAGFSLNKARFYKIKLRIEPRDEEPFEVTQEKSLAYYSLPSIGTTIQVKYDPDHRQHVVILGTANVYQTTSRSFNAAKLDPDLQSLMDM